MRAALAAVPRLGIQIERDLGGARQDGFWVSTGVTNPFPKFRASVQPTKPQELAHIPGGDEVTEAITLYTTDLLRVADDVQGRKADTLRYEGRQYKVIAALEWGGQGFHSFVAAPVPT